MLFVSYNVLFIVCWHLSLYDTRYAEQITLCVSKQNAQHFECYIQRHFGVCTFNTSCSCYLIYIIYTMSHDDKHSQMAEIIYWHTIRFCRSDYICLERETVQIHTLCLHTCMWSIVDIVAIQRILYMRTMQDNDLPSTLIQFNVGI